MTSQEQAREAAGRDELDLNRYVGIILKRKWIVLAVLAAGVTLAVLYTMRQTKIYMATASVVIDPAPPQVFGTQVQEVITLGAGSYWSNQEYYNTQVDILEGYDLAKLTVARNGLFDRVVKPLEGETLTEAQRIERAAKVLDHTLTASQNRESRIVKIRVVNSDKSLAADLANEHVNTYLEFTKSLRTTGSGEVAKFLSTELDSAEKRLRTSEQALYAFKKDNQILSVSLEDKQNILAADIAKFDGAFNDARIKRIELGTVRARAAGLAGEDLLESPVFALSSNLGTVEVLKEQYVKEKQRFTELAEDLGPKHPDYVKQEKKVAEIYSLIEKEATRARRELDERYQAALATENQFKGELERLKSEAYELGPKTIEYKRLDREQQSDEQHFTLVLGRLRDSELSKKNEQINVRQHESARSAILVYPRMKLNVALAFMLCLVLGVGLALLLELADRTLKTNEDVEIAARAPVLGMIPILDDVPNGDNVVALKARDLYVFSNPKSRAAECCRSIRTNLLFSGADRELKVLTVSSPNPREGKTTSVIYMGTTMAQSGQRVLLVDTDMRRPRLHKSMGVSRGLGLSNLILGESNFDDCIKTSDIPNLYVLPCGPTPPNPAELLLSERFQKILDQLRGKFDRILLDSPPLQAVTDAAVLARRSDGVIVVVQAGKTLRDDLARSAKQLHDVNANVIGVILNDLDISDRQYGYYYYNYGYGEDAGASGTNAKAESST
jgi:succinoglycan biosynthesis transport protein ExoP